MEVFHVFHVDLLPLTWAKYLKLIAQQAAALPLSPYFVFKCPKIALCFKNISCSLWTVKRQMVFVSLCSEQMKYKEPATPWSLTAACVAQDQLRHVMYLGGMLQSEMWQSTQENRKVDFINFVAPQRKLFHFIFSQHVSVFLHCERFWRVFVEYQEAPVPKARKEQLRKQFKFQDFMPRHDPRHSVTLDSAVRLQLQEIWTRSGRKYSNRCDLQQWYKQSYASCSFLLLNKCQQFCFGSYENVKDQIYLHLIRETIELDLYLLQLILHLGMMWQQST